MLLTTYCCPRCKSRLTRVTKWLGYCCEPCKLAVTLIGKEQVRITQISDSNQSVVPLSELCTSA